MLNIHELFFSYKDIPVLKGVGIDLDKGEILSVVGPNGTGKTTLLKCIARIVKPFKGLILIDGKDTCRMKRPELAKYLAYVPQNAPNKFPMTVFDAVLMGRRPHMSWKPSEHDLEIVADVLKTMNLDDFALRDFNRLSGGQMQKVLLARAVVQDVDYLLLDEPTSSLDLKHQIDVMEMLADLVREKKVGAVMAMHDLNLASRFSDTIVMLNGGTIFCKGKPFQVITAENIRAVYRVNATVVRNNGYPYILPDSTVN